MAKAQKFRIDWLKSHGKNDVMSPTHLQQISFFQLAESPKARTRKHSFESASSDSKQVNRTGTH